MTKKRDALHSLVERIAPGGRLVRRRRLCGGVSSIAERLDLETSDGSRQSLVVRRSADPEDHAHVTPEKFAYERTVLETIRPAVPLAPEPVLLDTEGTYFDTPAIVLRYIPGNPRFPGKALGPWALAMAQAMASVHQVTPDRLDLSALNVRLRDHMRRRIASLEEWSSADPLAAEVHAALAAHVDDLELPSPALTHGDFWTGNTIWQKGRVTGIVDWSGASLSDPRSDLADCRAELVMSRNLDAADTLRRAYEAAYGRPARGIAFFDLYRGLEPYLETDHWIDGAIDLGEQISPEDAHARVAEFLRRALASLRANSP